MTSSRPYLIKAILDWIVDNELTPYVLVDVTYKKVSVPESFIENDRITLDISLDAVSDFHMDLSAISFKASFSRKIYSIYIPSRAILSIYAAENGRGMFFDEEDEDDDGGDTELNISAPPPSRRERPQLKVVKSKKDK